MTTLATTAFDKMLADNAVRLYRLIAKFKNEYGYNTYVSSIRATVMFLTELMKDSQNMSLVEMKMLISKLSEIELGRRSLPVPLLTKDAQGNKFYDLRNSPLIGRLQGSTVDLQLLELPPNTLTILIVTVMNDARLKCIAFTDDSNLPFVEVGDLFERRATV